MALANPEKKTEIKDKPLSIARKLHKWLKENLTKQTIIQSYNPLIQTLYPINDQCSSSYRNQSIDLLCNSIDWLLYDG